MSLASETNGVPLRERDFIEKFRPGLVGSFALHMLVGLFVLYQLNALQASTTTITLPVDLVLLDSKTVAQDQAAGSPQTIRPLPQASRAPARPRASSPPVPPAPVVQPSIVVPPAPEPVETLPTPPRDELQSRLDSLAMLRAPEANGRSSGLGGAPGDGSGTGTYSVKDLIRAQVERRWNLSVGALKGRDITVSIRISLKRDGSVASTQIVDQERSARDPMFYAVATSARNAILLSSPFILPVGSYDDEFDVTVDLNPRDTLK
ncbi:MAG TPA: cell envelope integrity protein TolA [Micropepsaceae bacterium]|nr:cell envelope integrity protein TolA [Micropepsaceae bacterium]